MHRASRRWLVAACAAALTGLALTAASRAGAPAVVEDDPALERARAQVKMLDDLYKNAVVSITKTYKDGPPAAKVAKDVFGAMTKAGHHDAKLLDATGNPLNEANVPATDFEKRAADAMRAGKPYYEEVAGEGAERRLLVATVVPAVLPRCASCHGVDEGDLLGFIRYDLPVK
jgi:hypothetical protein